MLGVLTFVLCLPPQGEPTVAGRVLDEAGAPVANASVTLLHRPIARDPDATREHRVAVATNSQGVFRAPLRGDTIYSAWAANANAATHVAEGVDAGSFLELRLAAGTAPVVVSVPDLYTWPDAARFRYRAVVGSEHVDYATLAVTDGRLTVPPLPPLPGRTIEVLGSDGEVLWADAVATSPRGNVLHIPPPADVEVTVRDAAGAFLPGASVRRHVRTYATTASEAVFDRDRTHAAWANVGQTDAAGLLVFRLPIPLSGKPSLWLLTSKDGHTMSVDGLFEGKLFTAGVELPADQQTGARNRFAVTLQPGGPQPLALRHANGPWATDMLFVHARIRLTTERRRPEELFPLWLPIADGTATLPVPLPLGAELASAWTTLAPRERDQLRERLGLAPPAPFRLPRPWSLRAAVPDPQFEPQSWHMLQLTLADGRPAAQTPLLVLTERRRRDHPAPALSERRLLRTDRVGRVVFERLGDTRVVVFAAGGCASMLIEVFDEAPAHLVLQPMQRETGVVTNADGSPARGASVVMRLDAVGSSDFSQAHATLASLQPVAVSGDDGRFQLLLPPFLARLRLQVTGRDAKQTALATIDWDPKAPPPIVIALGKQ
ncbi:MAG TPA: carboxypeptidase-like regulatory domain-containing protein [Planctomycetota bacterium]